MLSLGRAQANKPNGFQALAEPKLPSDPPPELEAGYYVRNFEAVLATVSRRYGDLLTVEERTLAQSFGAASEGAKRLFVRLSSRKGPLFRRDLLSYPEIDDLDACIEELIQLHLLDRAADAAVADLVALLRMPELRKLAEEARPEPEETSLEQMPPLRRLRRPELLQLLVDSFPAEGVVAAVHEQYSVLRPLGEEVLLVFRLLFFGNLRQSWNEWVIRDLGIVRFEEYELRRDLRLFPDRRAVDHVLELRLARGRAWELVHGGDLDAAVELARRVKEGYLGWHELSRRHAEKVLARVGRELERAGRLDEALDLYAVCTRPPGRERRCRILDRQGRQGAALELTLEMQADPVDESEAFFAPAFAHRMEKKLGLRNDVFGRRRRPRQVLTLPPPSKLGSEENLGLEQGAGEAKDPPSYVGRATSLASGSTGRSIEWRALAALTEEGEEGIAKEGIYSENWLWRALFGLAFWDVIFAPVSGAFHHPFQSGPMDLFTADFRDARESVVAGRLEELARESNLETRLLPIYEEKQGIANSLVPWQTDFRPPLELALRNLRGAPVEKIFDRLSRNPGRFGRGLPDLLIFDPSSPVGFELLEVKGPGDQLRPEQKAWLDYFAGVGIPAKVLAVSWEE